MSLEEYLLKLIDCLQRGWWMMAIKLRYHARTFAKAIAALALASAFAALFSCSHNAVEPQVDPETQEVLVGFSHDSGI